MARGSGRNAVALQGGAGNSIRSPGRRSWRSRRKAYSHACRFGRCWRAWVTVVDFDLGRARQPAAPLRGAQPSGARISPRVLAVTLRAVERDGLVVRTAYVTVPPRVEYEVTPPGESLREAMKSDCGL